MSDATKELCTGARVTLSANCISGLVGQDTCRCWRCRGVEPAEEEPGWKRLAQLAGEGFHAEQRQRIRSCAPPLSGWPSPKRAS